MVFFSNSLRCATAQALIGTNEKKFLPLASARYENAQLSTMDADFVDNLNTDLFSRVEHDEMHPLSKKNRSLSVTQPVFRSDSWHRQGDQTDSATQVGKARQVSHHKGESVHHKASGISKSLDALRSPSFDEFFRGDDLLPTNDFGFGSLRDESLFDSSDNDDQITALDDVSGVRAHSFGGTAATDRTHSSTMSRSDNALDLDNTMPLAGAFAEPNFGMSAVTHGDRLSAPPMPIPQLDDFQLALCVKNAAKDVAERREEKNSGLADVPGQLPTTPGFGQVAQGGIQTPANRTFAWRVQLGRVQPSSEQTAKPTSRGAKRKTKKAKSAKQPGGKRKKPTAKATLPPPQPTLTTALDEENAAKQTELATTTVEKDVVGDQSPRHVVESLSDAKTTDANDVSSTQNATVDHLVTNDSTVLMTPTSSNSCRLPTQTKPALSVTTAANDKSSQKESTLRAQPQQPLSCLSADFVAEQLLRASANKNGDQTTTDEAPVDRILEWDFSKMKVAFVRAAAIYIAHGGTNCSDGDRPHVRRCIAEVFVALRATLQHTIAYRFVSLLFLRHTDERSKAIGANDFTSMPLGELLSIVFVVLGGGNGVFSDTFVGDVARQFDETDTCNCGTVDVAYQSAADFGATFPTLQSAAIHKKWSRCNVSPEKRVLWTVTLLQSPIRLCYSTDATLRALALSAQSGDLFEKHYSLLVTKPHRLNELSRRRDGVSERQPSPPQTVRNLAFEPQSVLHKLLKLCNVNCLPSLVLCMQNPAIAMHTSDLIEHFVSGGRFMALATLQRAVFSIEDSVTKVARRTVHNMISRTCLADDPQSVCDQSIAILCRLSASDDAASQGIQAILTLYDALDTTPALNSTQTATKDRSKTALIDILLTEDHQSAPPAVFEWLVNLIQRRSLQAAQRIITDIFSYRQRSSTDNLDEQYRFYEDVVGDQRAETSEGVAIAAAGACGTKAFVELPVLANCNGAVYVYTGRRDQDGRVLLVDFACKPHRLLAVEEVLFRQLDTQIYVRVVDQGRQIMSQPLWISPDALGVASVLDSTPFFDTRASVPHYWGIFCGLPVVEAVSHDSFSKTPSLADSGVGHQEDMQRDAQACAAMVRVQCTNVHNQGGSRSVQIPIDALYNFAAQLFSIDHVCNAKEAVDKVLGESDGNLLCSLPIFGTRAVANEEQ